MAAIKEDNVVRLKLINYDHPGEAGTVLTSQRTHSVGGSVTPLASIRVFWANLSWPAVGVKTHSRDH